VFLLSSSQRGLLLFERRRDRGELIREEREEHRREGKESRRDEVVAERRGMKSRKERSERVEQREVWKEEGKLESAKRERVRLDFQTSRNEAETNHAAYSSQL